MEIGEFGGRQSAASRDKRLISSSASPLSLSLSSGEVQNFQDVVRGDVKTETLTAHTSTFTLHSTTKYLFTSIQTYFTSVVTPVVTSTLKTATLYTGTVYTS